MVRSPYMTPPLLPVLGAEDAAAWDRRASQAGIHLATLMDAAGRGAAHVIAARYPGRVAGGVILAAGTGNNGGDGWVVARALAAAGASVWVASLEGERSTLCADAARLAMASGVRMLAPDGPWPGVALGVDAILGGGAQGAPRAPAQALLDRLHDLRIPIIALDGPTGLDLTTGVVHGNARADLSITFGGPRRGHLLARDQSGAVVVLDIGLPPAEVGWPRMVTDEWAAHQLPSFKAGDYKNTRGRIVIIGGAPGMSGAVRMAAHAAFAAGAGYVHAMAPALTIEELRLAEPEILTQECNLEADPGDDVLALAARADTVVLGPGMGRSDGRVPFILSIAAVAQRLVIDADALTVFQGRAAELARSVAGKPTLITPHPGEFRALVPDLDAEREVDPWGAAMDAAERLGLVVLLKGVPSVVAAPDRSAWAVAAGNPGLGTGGSGDVLSGVAGTFLAQLREPLVVGALAAQALGTAGDIAARRHTAHAMRPADVIEALPDVWRDWELRRNSGMNIRPPTMWELPEPARI
jgi:NAD(P)H-hydrate epimerase